MRVTPEVRALFRCPSCGGELADEGDDALVCTGCSTRFPLVRGVPVLIDEASCLFSIADYERSGERVSVGARKGGALHRVKDAVYGLLPDVNANIAAEANYDLFSKLLLGKTPRPRVLVVGGREVGRGMAEFLAQGALEFVETDIDFGPRTTMIADGHRLPFASGSFDGVVVQAVLEHVLDPRQVVSEIHRVLNPKGMVLADTPFLQKRHGGPFDFTRFTFLGHRRLFRQFEEIAAGASVGPGVALAWAWNGWLLSFTDRKSLRAALRIFGRLTSFWLKYLDRFLVKHEAAIDSASGYYFIGRRSEDTLPDRELIRQFRGVE